MQFLKRFFGRGLARTEANKKLGASSFDSELTELTANTITRERMALLWMEQGQLEGLSGVLSLGGDIFIDDFVAGGTRKAAMTSADLEWAKSVGKVAARADAAAKQRDFQAAIQLYKEALALAPGADIYLMSIGCCYGNMGFLEKGVTYLRCAKKISPASERIGNNLRALEEKLHKNPKPVSKLTAFQSREGPTPQFANSGPIRLKTIGDFLKLIGMRVVLTTKQGEEFEATVRDLSDTGTHVLLDDVLHIKYSDEPFDKIVRIARADLIDAGDLSQYVGTRTRLRMKQDGFVEGIIHSASKTVEHLELTGVHYYHPCERHSIRIDELTFVEVMDRRGIPF